MVGWKKSWNMCKKCKVSSGVVFFLFFYQEIWWFQTADFGKWIWISATITEKCDEKNNTTFWCTCWMDLWGKCGKCIENMARKICRKGFESKVIGTNNLDRFIIRSRKRICHLKRKTWKLLTYASFPKITIVFEGRVHFRDTTVKPWHVLKSLKETGRSKTLIILQIFATYSCQPWLVRNQPPPVASLDFFPMSQVYFPGSRRLTRPLPRLR